MTIDEWILANKTPEEIMTIMDSALDIMQQYNGRTKTYCIAVAAGFQAEEQDDGSYKYNFPDSEPTMSETYNNSFEFTNDLNEVHNHLRAIKSIIESKKWTNYLETIDDDHDTRFGARSYMLKCAIDDGLSDLDFDQLD